MESTSYVLELRCFGDSDGGVPGGVDEDFGLRGDGKGPNHGFVPGSQIGVEMLSLGLEGQQLVDDDPAIAPCGVL